MDVDSEEVAWVFRDVDGVGLAYVFGSVARGEAGELSDVDLAVYLDESVDESDYFCEEAAKYLREH
ncbi:MAG: nucleotidyltransferase domain-containing protein [Candidatus Nanohalobium sp.]